MYTTRQKLCWQNIIIKMHQLKWSCHHKDAAEAFYSDKHLRDADIKTAIQTTESTPWLLKFNLWKNVFSCFTSLDRKWSVRVQSKGILADCSMPVKWKQVMHSHLSFKWTGAKQWVMLYWKNSDLWHRPLNECPHRDAVCNLPLRQW